MSDLVVPRQQPDAEGAVHRITPETAGWTYVGCDVDTLKQGQTLKKRRTPFISATTWCR